MPSTMLLPENAEISGDARYVVRQGKMSGERQRIDGTKENISITKTGQGLFFQNKNHLTGKMYIDPKCVFRHKYSVNPVLHSRSSHRDELPSLGRRVCNDEELVKHMSNVPSFLQRTEKEDNVQEKALNFGVLDWKKLETWKYNERMPKRYPKTKPLSSSSISSASGPPKMSPNLRKHSSPQITPNPDTSSLGKQHVPHIPRFSSPKRQSASTPTSSHLNSSHKGLNNFGPPEKKYVEGIKSKEMELSNRKFQSAQKSCIDNSRHNDKGCSQRYVESCRRNNLEKKMLPKKVALSSEQGFNHELSQSSLNKSHASRQNSLMTLSSEEKLTAECCSMDSQQTVLLVAPKHSRDSSFSGNSQVSESGAYLDEQLAEAIRNKLHDFFSPQELYSAEFISNTPHSCPLPSHATTNKPPTVNQRFETRMDKISRPTANYVKPMRSEGKSSKIHEKTAHQHPASVDCDREQATIAVRPIEKGRSPSPSRFSFNLGKMSRSFSFKESSVIPQMKSAYISVRSGPVKSEVSSNMDKFGGKRDHDEIANSRGRSSPLRRLLDPLLKHKVAQSSNETSQPSKGRSNFMTFMKTHTKRQSQDMKNPGVSVYHALVQFTLKNGQCFFEFVVDDKNDMLAAAVKRSPTTEKADPCLIYTFYSVHEVRKKSMNWMSQGSKHKSGNLGYNAVGQMIISTSGRSDAMECTLYGAASGQATNEQTTGSVLNNEIAAIVVRYLNRKSMINEERENGNSNDTVLILPGGGGGHGLPVKGTPTSLISRWRSNGVCDCGGWDIGCKLRILTDSENESNVCPISTPKSLVNLFQQGEKQNRDPLFSMERLNNGYYSVALDSSISFLEAFATCVAYITCHEFPELVDTKLHKAGAEYMQEKIPGKYVTCPPLSPVGRI